MSNNNEKKHNYWTKLSMAELADYIIMLSNAFKYKNIEKSIYAAGDQLPENIISLYLYYINNLYKREFQLVIDDYKELYIESEANVEAGGGPMEGLGLGHIYDYIGVYDFSKKNPNVFLDGMKIHMLLYSECPFPEFGGKLRMEEVRLKDVDYVVPKASEARSEFQSYISKKFEFDDDSMFDYIDECIRICTRMIAIQPFRDGNKRTFRGLLNLLLARVGIPPIHINQSEIGIYKRVLLDAIKNGDYVGITRFYYYKICDTILDMNIHYFKKIYEEDNMSVGKRFVIEKMDDVES